MTYRHLLVERDGSVERLVLNRPEVRNAFNEELIAELTHWARRRHEGLDDVRVVVLAGAGPVFCAGGDLAYMRRAAAFSREDNLADAARLAAMFELLDQLPLPLVGRVHGAALGGGAGLAAVCDTVIADEAATFGFTEVRLGLVPASIGPYALAKVGRSVARDLFLSGSRFDARRAFEIGLAHEVAAAGTLDAAVQRHVEALLASAPGAISAAKRLIRQVWGLAPADAAPFTAEALATRRASEEGQEGLSAFLEKRRPRWCADE
jgi:methylglutaconyl-CoA hydratase